MIGLKIHKYPVTKIYSITLKQKTPRMWGLTVNHNFQSWILVQHFAAIP